MSVVDIGAVRRSFFRAVVDVANIVELEFLALCATIDISEFVACVERAVELYVTLREVQLLARATVHVVVAHRQDIRSGFIVRSLISTRCACQTIQWVISITMAYLSACLAALWERSIILYAQHVAHGVIAISIVHDGACLGIDREVL